MRRVEHRHAGILEALVHPMRQEARLAAGLEVEPVVVGVEAVAVPVAEHRLERHEAHEVLDVDELLEPRPALLHVGLGAGLGDGAEVRALDRRRRRLRGALLRLRRLRALVELELAVDILAEAAVVEVAARVLEVPLQEVAVERLLQHIEAEVAPVHHHARVLDARRGLTGAAEDLGGDPLAQQRLVLHRVVEMELREPVPRLGVAEPVDVDGEGGTVVELAEAPRRALELHACLRGDHALTLAHDARRVGARLRAELLHRLGREFDREARDARTLEERARIVTQRRRGREHREHRDHGEQDERASPHGGSMSDPGRSRRRPAARDGAGPHFRDTRPTPTASPRCPARRPRRCRRDPRPPFRRRPRPTAAAPGPADR